VNKSKVSIIGAGNIGGTIAHWLAIKEVGEIVLVDIVEGLPQGKALDLQQSCFIEGYSSDIKGTNDYSETKNSDVVIVTAGFARTEGMTREDLIDKNKSIVKEVVKKAVKYSPNCVLVVITNPVDVMSYVAYHESGFKRNKVLGVAGVLDTARFKYFVGKEIGISPEDVDAIVLGNHGDLMIPLVGHANVKGEPLPELLNIGKIDDIIEKTRNSGQEITSMLKDGSAFYAPAAAAASMVESILKNEKKVMPVSVCLNGEFGVHDLFIGVPVILGKNGAEKIVEFELDDEEKKMFEESVEHVRELVRRV